MGSLVPGKGNLKDHGGKKVLPDLYPLRTSSLNKSFI